MNAKVSKSYNVVTKYDDGSRPTGQCYDCGLPYDDPGWIEAVIPDRFWEAINPTYHEGAGLLCIACMARRLESLNLSVHVPLKIVSGPFLIIPDNDIDYLKGTVRNIQELIETLQYIDRKKR